MELKYKSTRGQSEPVTASKAILKGLAEDGGLYIPEMIPQLKVDIETLAKMSYQEVAYVIMKEYLTDFTETELKECISKAYDCKFDTKEIAPLVKAQGVYFLELFHGATIAFKDMALSILPHLLTVSAKKNNVNNEIVILTATSGDTGKAAMEGFADVEGTKIIVFYPQDGVSSIQEKQMRTQKGKNTFVVGMEGNFDDAQTGVKKLFHDKTLAEKLQQNGYQFSSANSINIGRLVPQIVYYVYAYSRLYSSGTVLRGEKIDVAVPTGNFGNILAAYYSKNMGLPIERLICASNENKVLADFFKEGIYNKNRQFHVTSSPSMDILVSSNLERLLYKMLGDNGVKCRECMEALEKNGKYEVKEKADEFYGNYATEQEIGEVIQKLYETDQYVIDTHTAVAFSVYEKFHKTHKEERKAVLVSTASPYKFARSVMTAIDRKYEGMPDFELIDEMGRISKIPVPNAIESIRNAPIRHDMVCKPEEMEKMVKEILNIK